VKPLWFLQTISNIAEFLRWLILGYSQKFPNIFDCLVRVFCPELLALRKKASWQLLIYVYIYFADVSARCVRIRPTHGVPQIKILLVTDACNISI